MASFAKLWTAEPHDTLDRWSGDGSDDGWRATTVPAAFAHKARLHADRVLLRVKRSKSQQHWEEWTWAKYHGEARRTARALIAMGFEAHDAVSILGWNSPEWFCAALGAILAGGMAAGVYTTNSADGLGYIVSHSRSKVLFVDSEPQLAKALKIRQTCPALMRVVSWGPDAALGTAHGGFALDWSSFLATGTSAAEAELVRREDAQVPGGACYLSYTSGTTGNPKAVMCSHDSALFGFRSWFTHGWQGIDMGLEERNVSYLPCSHMAGSVDIFAPLARDDHVHSTVHFAFPDAMQGSLEDTLCDVLPTYFNAVPRVWQKLEPVLRQAQRDTPTPTEARAVIGLQNTKWHICGSAPMEPETLRFYASLGMRIDEIYGMTENTAVALMCNGLNQRIGSIGVPVVPHSVKLMEGTDEICTRHRATMMGYMYEPDRTRSEFDVDGWLHSGDIGARDEDGFYKIVGRIKELIITAGGENIPPVPIETALKELLPCVSNAVVIGDGQKMLVCLFTPKLALNVSAEGPMWQTDLAWESKALDAGAATGADASASEVWKAELSKGIERYNKEKAVSRAQHIRKWALLPMDFVWGTPDAELTPTQKLKRDVVHKKYASAIRQLYGEDFKVMSWADETPQAKL